MRVIVEAGTHIGIVGCYGVKTFRFRGTPSKREALRRIIGEICGGHRESQRLVGQPRMLKFNQGDKYVWFGWSPSRSKSGFEFKISARQWFRMS